MARILIWAILACAIVAPLAVAATSPLLAYRSAVYIASGLAGAAALAILLMQPLLAAGYLPGLNPVSACRWHRWLGTALVVAVALHIVGLYLTSPPDALDALLLVSPTPFSVYGVIGLWSLVATALFVAARRRLRLRPITWKIVHNVFAAIVVVSSVVHALLIDGTMGATSKLILCICVLGATAIAILHLRVIKPLSKNR